MILIWQLRKNRQINLSHYRSIFTTSMGLSPYSNNIRQFEFLPIAFSEQSTKYNVCLYFCLYSTYFILNIIACCLNYGHLLAYIRTYVYMHMHIFENFMYVAINNILSMLNKRDE